MGNGRCLLAALPTPADTSSRNNPQKDQGFQPAQRRSRATKNCQTPKINNKRGRRRLSGPSFNSFQWPRCLIDSMTLKKYTWTWSTSAWHGPMKKASQNQPKSRRIWYNRTFLLLEEQRWWDWGAIQNSDGGGEILINHCERHRQRSLEIDLLYNSADNKNTFKCNSFWWPML